MSVYAVDRAVVSPHEIHMCMTVFIASTTVDVKENIVWSMYMANSDVSSGSNYFNILFRICFIIIVNTLINNNEEKRIDYRTVFRFCNILL